ncbi:hypothetical protein D3C84_656790 [compost metagenome]
MVGFDSGIACRNSIIHLLGKAVRFCGELLMPTNHPVAPPLWQAGTNGLWPDRIEGVRQMPKHASAAQPAAFEGRSVNTEPGVPMACVIEGDRLLVGFLVRAAQPKAA